MTETNYNELLLKKVAQEYKELTDSLEKLVTHEALSHAYEKVIKEDLVCCIGESELTQNEAKALLKLKKPLDALYSEWLHNDLSCNDLLRDTVKDRAASAVREMKNRSLDAR